VDLLWGEAVGEFVEIDGRISDLSTAYQMSLLRLRKGAAMCLMSGFAQTA